MRAGDWKLTWFDGEDPHIIQQREYEHAPMGDGWFLADLSTDVGEQHNRLADEPEIVDQLTTWRAEVGLDQPGLT